MGFIKEERELTYMLRTNFSILKSQEIYFTMYKAVYDDSIYYHNGNISSKQRVVHCYKPSAMSHVYSLTA